SQLYPTPPPLDSVGDGIPDAWRLQYFGDPTNITSSSCATCDADGTGQNNLFKYVAGLDPTNPASIFLFSIADVTAQPNRKSLIFQPPTAGRFYVPQFRLDLTTGTWATLTGITGPQT